jgi:hypothetical protein
MEAAGKSPDRIAASAAALLNSELLPQSIESRITPQLLESRLHDVVSQRTVVDRLLEPHERTIQITQAGVHHGHAI